MGRLLWCIRMFVCSTEPLLVLRHKFSEINETCPYIGKHNLLGEGTVRKELETLCS
jgi:hypothetical protein